MSDTPFVSDRATIEAVCRGLSMAQASQLPLWQAAADGRIGIICIAEAKADWPRAAVERINRPTVALVGADRGDGNDPLPDAWRCARKLKHWCRSAIVHGAGGEADHYRLANAMSALTIELRIALRSNNSETSTPWEFSHEGAQGSSRSCPCSTHQLMPRQAPP